MYWPSFPDAPTMHTLFARGDPCARTSPSTGGRWGRSLLVSIVAALVIVVLLLDCAEVGDTAAPRSCTRSIATARCAPKDTEVLFGVLFGVLRGGVVREKTCSGCGRIGRAQAALATALACIPSRR